MTGKSKKLYMPAEFARIVGMTKRALRHYNELGILIPSYINELGHKFYSDYNFYEAQRILSLRFIGFSLEEIRDIQKSHSGIKESLKIQHDAMQEKVDQIQTIITAISDMENTVEQSGEIVWEHIFNVVKFAKYEMVKEKMMEYYDERAKEYDEIYDGKGPATLKPKFYATDIQGIERFMENFGKGNIIDIACGSGYWLKYYYYRCSTFTFFDQSEQMIKECKRRANEYGIMDRSKIIRSDILDYIFDVNDKYDSALIGFLLSHFTKAQEEVFFTKLKSILKPGSEILIIDSTWTKERAKKQNKEDIVERYLNDGRSYKIYKKYFDVDDLPALLNNYGITVKDCFFGNTFVAVIGIV
jgi:DNA-binding transcriptional MerR regulator